MPDKIRIEGVVRDERGAFIAKAEVVLISSNPVINLSTKTDENGRFVFDLHKVQNGKLTIKAEGFSQLQKEWKASDTSLIVEIVLSPAVISEEITITGATTRLEETPASVVALSRTEFEASPAASLDDRLRQIPGFSLFRRSGSRAANPTAQGVSLRGVGASGASRALVLADGVPLNDPFGGWVYWGRVPSESISQVEVLRGAASDSYGSGAIGGVVSITTRKPASQPVLNLEAAYGNQKTGNFSVFTSAGLNKWLASLSAETFQTGGYFLLDDCERGLVDTPANVRRGAITLTLERSFNEGGRVFASGSLYDESRNNGTRLQTNDTRIRQLVVGGDWKSEQTGAFSARAYGGNQTYRQSFSAVAANRGSETLTRLQRVPAQILGFAGQWSQTFGAKNMLIAGLSSREVRGRSEETIFSNNRAVSAVSAGGREFTFGVFASDVWNVNSRLVLSGGLRFDRWRNLAASSATTPLVTASPSTVAVFPNRSESAASPRASLLWRLTGNLSLSASAASAFRQPTLNELYRSFRIGDVLTLANENLRAERAASVETGAIASGFNRRLYLRSTFFLTQISSPVANVTLQATPQLVTRQRQNLGRTRSRGVEIDFDFKADEHWNVSGGYLLADSRVIEFPADLTLVGRRLPQVPRHQFTFQLRYNNPSIFAASLQARASGAQFDDDQNRLRLGGYFALDAIISKPLTRNLAAFFAAENLLNQRYEVGRTPLVTLSPPLTFRAGVRLRFGSR